MHIRVKAVIFLTKTTNKGKLINITYLLLCLILLLSASNTQARFADHLEVGNISNANFGVWTQAGNVSTRIQSCISSASDDSPRPRGWFVWQAPYQVKIENLSGDTNYYLYLNGDDSNTGNRRIAFYFSHRDTKDGNNFEALSHNNYDSHSHVGSYRSCLSGDNSELRIDISGAELNEKVSGYYTGTFRLTAIGGIWGNNTDSIEFSVSIEIQSTTEVQISGLDDLGLGSHSGLGNIYAEESFCVYSSSLSGSYTLSITSSNQDSSGNFYLAGTGSESIPYRLNFVDNPTGPANTPVGKSSLSGYGNTEYHDCRGANNATLSISINEMDLQAASSGHYQDSLVILVEPQ
jgi:spore coat protein U-like protein